MSSKDSQQALNPIISNDFTNQKSQLEKELGGQVTITAAFDGERRRLRSEYAKEAEDRREEAKNLPDGDPNKLRLEAEAQKIERNIRLFDGLASALYTPNTGGAVGDVARAVSPHMAYKIGQYFKSNDYKNTQDNQNRPGEQSLQHLMAHAILGAATSYATGQDIGIGALSAVSSETAAPALSKFLFGKDSKELTQDEKDTITNIITLATASTAYAITDGDVAGSVSAAEVGRVGVGNNYLVHKKTNEHSSPRESLNNYNMYELLIKLGLTDIGQVDNDVLSKIAEDYLYEGEEKSSSEYLEIMKNEVISVSGDNIFYAHDIIDVEILEHLISSNTANNRFFRSYKDLPKLLELIRDNPNAKIIISDKPSNKINLIRKQSVNIEEPKGFWKFFPFFNDPKLKYGDFYLDEIIINPNGKGVSETHATPKVYQHNYNSGHYELYVAKGDSFDAMGESQKQPDYIEAAKKGLSIGTETGLTNDSILQTTKTISGLMHGINTNKNLRNIDNKLLDQVRSNAIAQKRNVAYSQGAIGNKIIDGSDFDNFTNEHLRRGLDRGKQGSVKWHTFPGVQNGGDGKLIIEDKELYLDSLARIYDATNMPLNNRTRQLISDSIDRSNTYAAATGLPGTHSEIRTYNALTTKYPDVKDSEITIATVRGGDIDNYNTGKDFAACTSCTSILPKDVNVPTGRTKPVSKGKNWSNGRFVREE